MAKKKKSKIKKVVETVESWVGMGPKATKKKTPKAAKGAKKKAKTATPPKTKKAAKKKAK
jgi:hypothetical protein